MSKFSKEEGADKPGNRGGQDRKSTGGGARKAPAKGVNGGDRKTFGEKRSFNRDDKKPFSREGGDRDRKPYGKREDSGSGGSSERKFGGNSDRKPRFDKREGDNKEGFSEKRPYNRSKPDFNKPASDRKFGNSSTGRKPRFDNNEGGEKKSFGEKGTFNRDDKKPFNREGGDRKSFGEKRPFNRDDKKPFNREGGERKSFGEKRPFNSDDKKPYNREGGDRKSYGEKRPFNRDDKKPYSREGGDRDRKPYGKKEDGPRDFKKDNDRPRKPGAADDNGKSAYKTPHRHKRDVKEEEDMAAAQPVPAGKRTKKRRKDDDDEDEETEAKEMWPMPLNKYIAHSGECSRREAAELVKQGKVKVNGELVTDPGRRVEESDLVTLVGKKLTPSKHFAYILLNKPKGFITTTDDPQERHTVMELVANSDVERLYPVGRLDRNTTGLLLMTNDGALTQKLSHPGYEVKKVYQVTLDKPLTKAHFEQIAAGLELEDGPVKVDEIAYLEDKKDIGLEIHSGRNRIVRRIFESLGYVVEKLDRMMYAGLTKKNLPRSKWRFLTEEEVIRLKHFKS